MAMEIYKTKYVICNLSNDKETITNVFQPETKTMTEQEHTKFINELVELSLQYKPKYFLDDSRQMKYFYPPERQEWIISILVPKWIEIGLKKYAQVYAKDVVAQLAGEQIVDEANETLPNMFETKIFENIKEAENWLKE